MDYSQLTDEELIQQYNAQNQSGLDYSNMTDDELMNEYNKQQSVNNKKCRST